MKLGRKRVWVVHGENGMDEISPVGSTRIVDIQDNTMYNYQLQPSDLGWALAPTESRAGIKLIPAWRGFDASSAAAEAVLLNTAGALMTAGRAGICRAC